MSNTSTSVVLKFIEALNSENFAAAKSCLADDMRFIGVLGARNSAGGYIRDMEHMRFKYIIKKVFTDGNDVCLWYDIDMQGTTALCSGWYHLVDDKIKTF